LFTPVCLCHQAV